MNVLWELPEDVPEANVLDTISGIPPGWRVVWDKDAVVFYNAREQRRISVQDAVVEFGWEEHRDIEAIRDFMREFRMSKLSAPNGQRVKERSARREAKKEKNKNKRKVASQTQGPVKRRKTGGGIQESFEDLFGSITSVVKDKDDGGGVEDGKKGVIDEDEEEKGGEEDERWGEDTRNMSLLKRRLNSATARKASPCRGLLLRKQIKGPSLRSMFASKGRSIMYKDVRK
jgi:hypothetical protein